MTDHLAVLERILAVVKCRRLNYEEQQDFAAAIALMRGQSEPVGYVNAEQLMRFVSGTNSATAVLYKRNSRWRGLRRVPVYAAPCEPAGSGEVLGWINEDELPCGYPYDAMFPHSRVDGVRMFPVCAHGDAEDMAVALSELASALRQQAGIQHSPFRPTYCGRTNVSFERMAQINDEAAALLRKLQQGNSNGT